MLTSRIPIGAHFAIYVILIYVKLLIIGISLGFPPSHTSCLNSGDLDISQPGLVSCVLPITADTVLAVLAIDDVGSPGAGVIGWVTSQTDGQQVTFGCDVNISRFVYAAICR